MNRKILIAFAVIFAIVCALVSCSEGNSGGTVDMGNGDAENGGDGVENGNGNNEENGDSEEGDPDGAWITSPSATVEDGKLSFIISNVSEAFSFADNIAVANGATYEISTDSGFQNIIDGSNADINVGDNTFYIRVTVGEKTKVYTVTVRRSPVYTVSFDTNGGSAIESQTVEEGALAVIPAAPKKIGYSFVGWDYDLSKPITGDITVKARYEAVKGLEDYIYTVTDTDLTIVSVIYKDVREVTVPDGVTRIGENAFKGCDRLTSVELPSSVTHIGEMAFYGCESLKYITLPDGIISIGKEAFNETYYYYNNRRGTELYIGNHLIHSSANSNYSDISVRAGTKCIADYAFSGCYKVPEITIPASVTHIGYRAFPDSNALISINVSSDNEYYQSIKGCLYSKDGKTLIKYAGKKSGLATELALRIPEGVTEIAPNACKNASSLSTVYLPETLVTIGEGAFSGCGILSITIPASVTEIGAYAFNECRYLTSVKFGNKENWFARSVINNQGTEIERSRIDNASTASVSLSQTYTSYVWKREN